MEIGSLTLKSFNVYVIYRIKIIEHTLVSFLLILESFNEIWGLLSEFGKSVSYGVVNRDKVGNFGRLDDQTLFGNRSNLHTKIAFTHDIFRWNHKVRPVVSLSAIQWTTLSVFSRNLSAKIAVLIRDAAKLISLLSSPLGRDWERGQLSPHQWRARNFRSYYASHVCHSGKLLSRLLSYLRES